MYPQATVSHICFSFFKASVLVHLTEFKEKLANLPFIVAEETLCTD